MAYKYKKTFIFVSLYSNAFIIHCIFYSFTMSHYFNNLYYPFL